jgi:hypothetical protein
MSVKQVISVIDLNSELVIWDGYSAGTISVSSGGNYNLTFSGFNSPKLGDNVLVVYFADDIGRVQPFTYENDILKSDLQSMLFNFSTNTFYIPINNFVDETGLHFNIIDNTTGLSIGSGSDGYISSVASDGYLATFFSNSFNFSTVDDILGKSLNIFHANNINNDGYFNILSYNNINNSLGLTISSNNLNANQISIIRLEDNKDLWTSSCSIDVIDNILNLPPSTLVSQNDKVMVLIFNNKNLHQSPTKLAITISDQINNTGVLTTSGTTITEVVDVVFTATSNSLKQNILEAMKTFLNLNSNASIGSNNYIARIIKLDRVSTTTNNDILSTINSYDVSGTMISNNLFYMNEMIYNNSLQNIEFQLPATTNNLANIPQIGDKLRITFYYATTNDSENVYFTRNGTLYTNKRFAHIEKIYISSGFNSSKSARITFAYFTQPLTGSRYTAFYNYLAPKTNERILINYNYNKLITDTTFTIEGQRPINADILVKSATGILIDATINIVVKAASIDSAAIVLQNVKDRITSSINTNKFGDILNSSDLVVAAQAVDGVERARVIYFNRDGIQGQVLTITGQENEYFSANTVLINQESS